MSEYYAIWYNVRYLHMEGEHTGVSRKLFTTRLKAENAIDEFRKDIIHQSRETHKGLLEFDPTTLKCRIIDFKIEE